MVTELKDLDDEITTEDLEGIEDALYEAAKERAVDLEKEEREEDLEDCEEVSGPYGSGEEVILREWRKVGRS